MQIATTIMEALDAKGVLSLSMYDNEGLKKMLQQLQIIIQAN